ncbi:bifunctional phosphoserine phosphatase/homoserine phosphotransferase ThrH [Candidatus Gracilibacteria bacterium]|nr:bifunctional phosphoserine phosphatase/homoserine phosphotransferase ThrH [Candidatus Gracilibacteria bacterium]
MKQTILCLDMEGVLTPEIWEEVSKNTGIKELMLTTKDIADYDELMNYRKLHMNNNGLTLSKIQEVISTIDLLPGAIDFMNWAKDNMQVVILSDTFIEFAKPLLKKMGNPTIFCHNLIIEDNKIVDYKLRIKDQKTEAVKRFKELNFNVIAAGDSFNDTGMLNEANFGFFFKPGKKATDAFPNIPVAQSYEELKTFIEKSL